MASFSSTSLSASASSSFSALSNASSGFLHYCHSATLSFPLSAKSTRLRLSNKGSLKYSTVVKAQSNEVSVAGPSNDATTPPTKSEVPGVETKDAKASNDPSPETLTAEESISEFITQVASLVKLVDSTDIVELQLKQLDCELIIRKKAALPQPPSPAPTVMMHAPTPPPVMPMAPPASAPTPAASAPSPTPSPSTPTPAAKLAKSSLPSLKCPMAGTFYRSPAPGEPPFVKVGDEVQKGQVLCIIEAMKLMNEIEADQSGTIIEVLVEDRKPVSVDTPLFVIKP